MSEPFIAEVRIFAGNFAPRGWAFCDGQILPVSQNTALFSLVGTVYGGDGRTTFGVPDLQGRAPMHPGNGPGLTSRSLGQKGGTETVTLSEAEMPAHTHSFYGQASDLAVEREPAPGRFLASTRAPSRSAGAANATMAPMSSAGGGYPHNNMQPYLTLNFIIALQGLWPSRS